MATVTASELLILDEKRFDKEHSAWQEYTADYEWWEFAYANFKSKCDDLGIRVDSISFSGFWSQGDGAAFAGRINLASLMENTGLHITYPALYLAVKDDGSYFMVREGQGNNIRGGSYECYANQTAPSGVFSGLDQQAWEELIEEQERDAQLEDVALEFCNELAHTLYKDLEEEYDHITSKEAFIESCEANEITFEIETEEEEPS